MKEQIDMFYDAQKNMADRNNTFLHIIETLTLEEFNHLCIKRPYLYERYRKFAESYRRKPGVL